MKQVTCISEGVYSDALTRGQSYTILDINEEAQHIRIRGDNQRHRWFPFYCFDFENRTVPQLVMYSIDDPDNLNDPANTCIEVTIKLSTGELRWCWFCTPPALAQNGDWIPNTKIRLHYHNAHLIVANEITYETVEKALIYLDTQNKLIDCTLPVDNEA